LPGLINRPARCRLNAACSGAPQAASTACSVTCVRFGALVPVSIYHSAAFSARFGRSGGIPLRANNTWRYASSQRKPQRLTKSLSSSIKRNAVPNPPLNSDPACIAFRSLSTSCFLGSAQRFGAGVAG